MTVTPIILPIVILTRLLTSKMISSRCSMMQTNRSIYNKKYCVRQEPATAVSLSLLLTLVCHVRIMHQGITLSVCQSVRCSHLGLFAPLLTIIINGFSCWRISMWTAGGGFIQLWNWSHKWTSRPLIFIGKDSGPGKRVVICWWWYYRTGP